MYRPRIIPCLLVQGNGLVKTRKFRSPIYVGDPVNAVRIFSEKEVDEIVVLDIDASRLGHAPNYRLIEEMAGEAFMPLAYGGGLSTLAQVDTLIGLGIEKVVINTAAIESTELISEAAAKYGSQAIVGGIDVRRSMFGAVKVVCKSATVDTGIELDVHVKRLVEAGVGEIFLNSVDRDGMMRGYDIDLIRRVAQSVAVPVVACGGAGCADDLREAIQKGGASAVAAGSMFVFHGKHKAVLINYPKGSFSI